MIVLFRSKIKQGKNEASCGILEMSGLALVLLRAKRLFLFGLLVVASGCGGSGGLEELSGHVTLTDGSPLVRARVIFRSNEAGNFSARTDGEGNYTAGSASGVEGIAPGTYKVTIMEYQGDMDHPTPPKVALKYGLVRKSGLQVTVPAEGGTYDIVLEAPQ